MFNGLRRQWRDLRKGRPGHRFQERYKRNRKGGEGRSWIRRFLQPAIAVLILLAGIVLCIIPGPGLPLVLVGLTLLAQRSRSIARAMDWCEVKLRMLITWGKGWWTQASFAARNLALVMAACVAAGAAYGAYQVFINR